jgi:hypothetical protein
MKIINKIMTALLVSISCSASAGISELHPVAPDESNDPTRYGDSGGGLLLSSDGRYVVYPDADKTVTPNKIRFHRYDTQTHSILSSDYFIAETYHLASVPYAITSDANIIAFNYEGASNEFEDENQYTYNFTSQEFLKSSYKNDIYNLSKNGQFQLGYTSKSGGKYTDFVRNRITGDEVNISEVDINSDGSQIEDFSDVIGNISNKGDLIVKDKSDNELFKFNAFTNNVYSITDELNKISDFSINVGQRIGLISMSPDGRYVSVVGQKVTGDNSSVYLLLDTNTNIIKRYDTNEKYLGTIVLPDTVSNNGIGIFLSFGKTVDEIQTTLGANIIYDFISEDVVSHIEIDQQSNDGSVYGYYIISSNGKTALAASNSSNLNSYQMKWSSINSTQDVISISVNPKDLVVDPYSNLNSIFSVDVTGSDIYGLDVSCNLSSTALTVTQANYNGLFGSQNAMTLPLIYNASSVTGAETLIAPELPFTGAGSFVLADVVAEFTTEDVQVICAAEVSDKNGQLLQVTLTPATIRIDDGVHGGAGSVSGVIEIPGVADLSGVEVVLTIDGRQVTVITDGTGHFEFEGLRDGEFTISLASDNYVQSCQAANVAEGSAVNLGSIELLAGDINADGSIDIADFTFMAARYRSNQGDADYDAKADLNKDGVINIQDLAILGSHFGSTQCNL